MRSKSLLGRAPQPLGVRKHWSGVPRGHLALEISARACFFGPGNTRKRRFSVSARSRGSSKRRWIRRRFRVSCGIPFEIPFKIALLRTLHCFEMCFARLHRHRQVPYANLVYMYIYTYIYTHIYIYIYKGETPLCTTTSFNESSIFPVGSQISNIVESFPKNFRFA